MSAQGQLVEQPEPDMFTTGWRTLQVQKGLLILDRVTALGGDMSGAAIANMIAMAGVYMAAANVRSRPGESAPKPKLPVEDLSWR